VIDRAIEMSGTRTRDDEYARVLEEHGRAIRRLAITYERDPVRREDLEQDIWIAIWQALPAFRGDCSLRTFVFRIAHNRAVSHIQSHRRHSSETLGSDRAIFDPRVSPEDSAVLTERHDRLHAAVQQLPLAMRQVVVLMLEGLTHREIREVVGISEANVAVRLTRAKTALRALLGAREGRR
jgi:RNA polymerase sigma-70 factor (ECF subfamily)